MALFGKSNKLTDEIKTSGSNSVTIITECMNIKGDIKGCGAIRIDGTIDGSLVLDDNIIIGKSGVVNGDISAKKVIVSGTLNGMITCDLLEVTQTGIIGTDINAKKIISDGKLSGTITAEEMIHITENGTVKADNIKSKLILVNGRIVGNVIATELLEINKEGQVKGEMTVKKLKVTEGGLMLGTMLTYQSSNAVKKVAETKDKVLEPKKQTKQEK